MDGETQSFPCRIAALLQRFYRQNDVEPPARAELLRRGARLHDVIAAEGLPRLPSAGDVGEPGSISDAAAATIVARVVDETWDALGRDALRQLVKAFFNPDFRVCRDSYRECTRDGGCRRQELERVRRRISGSHCVDCPYWTDFAAPEHASRLREAWSGDVAEFMRHRDVFLPEDFRWLRAWRLRRQQEGF